MGKFKEPKLQDPFKDPEFKRLNTRASDDVVQAIVKRALEIWQAPSIHPAADESILDLGHTHGATENVNGTFTIIRFEGDSTTHPEIAISTRRAEELPDLVGQDLTIMTDFVFKPKTRFWGPPKEYEAAGVSEVLGIHTRDDKGEFYPPTPSFAAASSNAGDQRAVAGELEPQKPDLSIAQADFVYRLLLDFNPEMAAPLPENVQSEGNNG